MSYTPTTWAAGDTVTAAKLNKLEQGVASSGGVLVVTEASNSAKSVETKAEHIISLDKTWQEIYDAKVAMLDALDGFRYMIEKIAGAEGMYGVGFSNSKVYVTDTANGHPVRQ